VYIQLSRDELMKRITGRRTCKNCQAVYHIEFNLPKTEGVCDKCGGQVIQRADDADEAAVARRLDIYFEQTTPVIEYYRDEKVLHELDGSLGIDEVGKAVLAAIGFEPARKVAQKPVKKAPAKKAAKKVAAKKLVKKATTKRVTTKKAAGKLSSRK
jgi:hypothetical protein